MADLLLVLIMAAFFGLALLFVKACERIVGPDIEATRVDADPVAAESEVAA
jgi:uncharacterized iron-regulated membrane protein